MARAHASAILLLLIAGSPALAGAGIDAPSIAPSVPFAVASIPWRPQAVIALAERVGDHQLATMAAGLKPNPAAPYPDPRGWEQGALFVGLASLADHSPRPEFKAVILARGEANGWQPGERTYDADDLVIASSYLWASRHGAGDAAVAPLQARLDRILAAPPSGGLEFPDDGPSCRDRWCWCDALFMAPPAWLEMSRVTGDARYARFAMQEMRATTGALYDPATHLWFRDSRFIGRRDADGHKLFWSRGNGWVFAGLARMIPLLPEGDPERAYLQALFRDMARALAGLQKPDGFWPPSLLGDPAASLPESSGTGFHVFGLAWGIRAGLLDRATYEPHVRRGWAALVRSVRADGRLGYVQPVGDRPDAVGYDDTQLYGVGAFLLAAGAVADLDLAPPPVAAELAVTNPSRFDQPAAIVRVAIALPASAAGGWSVESESRIYPAELEEGTLAFVLPIKARQVLRVRVLPQPAALPDLVHAVLNVQEGGTRRDGVFRGGTFHLRGRYAVPADHVVHDGLIAFEGVGWESDKIAYRLYLDERAAIDIYGKKLPGAILPRIGQNTGDYHAMSDWGQDIFQVDQSLGLGGIGIVRDGRATQLGPAAIGVEVANTAISARATVRYGGYDAGRSSLQVEYAMFHGQALTFVDASATGAVEPVATGFRHAQGVTLMEGAAHGDWNYVATWGQQDLTGDALGLAVFFHPAEIDGGVRDDGQDLYVAFRDPARVHYAFGAKWVQDGSGVRDEQGFRAWLEATLDGLEHPPVARRVPAGAR